MKQPEPKMITDFVALPEDMEILPICSLLLQCQNRARWRYTEHYIEYEFTGHACDECKGKYDAGTLDKERYQQEPEVAKEPMEKKEKANRKQSPASIVREMAHLMTEPQASPGESHSKILEALKTAFPDRPERKLKRIIKKTLRKLNSTTTDDKEESDEKDDA